ncbi:ENHANCED DOWNY MILDEW 2-like protein [Drosera capensis]
MFAEKEKIQKILSCSLLFVDAAQSHTTENVYQGRFLLMVVRKRGKHDIDDELELLHGTTLRFPDFGNKVIRQFSSLSRSRDVPSSLKSRQSLGPTATWRTSLKSVHDNMKLTITKEVKVQKYPKTTFEVLKGVASRKPSTGNKAVAMKKEKSLVTDLAERSIGEQLYAAHSEQFNAVKITKLGKVANDVNSPKKPQPASTSLSSQIPQLDQASKNRILGLIEEAKSSVTMDDIPDNPDDVSTHGSSMKAFVEKTVTLGKVEGGIEAIRTALKKLDEGYTIEDTKTFCEPNVLNQLSKWKERLRVYLAPFLNGMRYTSFGRHFTKVDRLKEIIDFCCGANDFSLLMKEKLDQMGKKCYFKNFDIMPPEIMGLNPPFGCKAALANRLINKALEFRPKLVILLCLPRQDRKRKPYDLVWDDNQKLSGKSFYLPGSIDVNDKPIEDWNNVPPPLYLWSRQDWSAEHKDIAEMHGHLGGSVEFQSPDETKGTKSALEIATEPVCEAAANPAQDTSAKSALETPAKHAQETSWKPTQETAANPTPNASVNRTPVAAANPTSDIAAYSALGIRDEDGDVTMEADDEPRLNDAPND